MSGWISLHRKIMEHPFYTEKRKFSRYEAWIDLIMLANHQDNKFMLGNQLIEVKRGSFITSELKLMDRWDWSKEKLRAFLKLLEADGMIIKESTTKQTTITICNYEKHSSKSDRIESSNNNGSEDEADRQQTAGRPLADYEPYTNNNINNINNLNNLKDSTPITTSTRVYHENPFSLFETHKFGKLDSLSREIIGDTIDTYSEEWVIRAIKESVKSNVIVWNYVEKILKRWKLTDHAEPWTLEKEEPQQKQTNLRQFNQGSSKKPNLPIITDSPKSAPMSAEERLAMDIMVDLLDGASNH